jgi:branched-subunit amino acid aminotransferase/4-amino-4-deoxychorismate lyase
VTELKHRPRVEIDGAPATEDGLRDLALSGYGHFTAMQVRDRRVRGIGLHMSRLDAANRELFGAGLDAAEVRSSISRALGDDVRDASVRVLVTESQGRAPRVTVTVRPPAIMQPASWKLRSVPYQRAVAHIKHLGDFGQGYYQRAVRAAGFDEALLTGPDGVISEGSITNVGFYDGTTVIWPAAPVLDGTTMQLLDNGLGRHGLASRRGHVRLSDLGALAAVFVANAHGIAPVRQIDDVAISVDQRLMTTLHEVLDSAGWDDIDGPVP